MLLSQKITPARFACLCFVCGPRSVAAAKLPPTLEATSFPGSSLYRREDPGNEVALEELRVTIQVGVYEYY